MPHGTAFARWLFSCSPEALLAAEVFAVATEDGVYKYKLTKLFRLLAITQTDRINGGLFGDMDGLPTNYVIDKAGVLRYAKAGAFDLDGLNDVIVPLVNEPAQTQ